MLAPAPLDKGICVQRGDPCRVIPGVVDAPAHAGATRGRRLVPVAGFQRGTRLPFCAGLAGEPGRLATKRRATRGAAFIFLARGRGPNTLQHMDNPLLRAWRSLVAEAPRAAVVTEAHSGRTWSRGELAAGAARVSGACRNHIPDPLRRRIAIALHNGAAWLETFIGLLEAGAVPVPIDPSEPEAAQLEAARCSGATHFLKGGRFARFPGSRHSEQARSLCLVKLTRGSTGRTKALAASALSIGGTVGNRVGRCLSASAARAWGRGLEAQMTRVP